MPIEPDHPINPHPDQFGVVPLPVPHDLTQWQKDLCDRIRQAAERGERIHWPRRNGKAWLAEWIKNNQEALCPKK